MQGPPDLLQGKGRWAPPRSVVFVCLSEEGNLSGRSDSWHPQELPRRLSSSGDVPFSTPAAMMESWKRKEKRVALAWGTTNFEECKLHELECSPPDGEGELGRTACLDSIVSVMPRVGCDGMESQVRLRRWHGFVIGRAL